MSKVELRLTTRVGRAIHGENLFFGYRVGSELLGRTTLTELTALAITGRRPTSAQVELLDEIATVLSSADPRIWLFKATRLGASYGGIVSGLAAGMLTLHRASVGHLTATQAASTLAAIARTGVDAEDADSIAKAVESVLAQSGRITGFGVPFRPADERAVQLTQRLKERGATNARFFRLYEAVSAHLAQTRSIAANLGGCLAAAMLDSGFLPAEIGPLVLALGQHTFFANAVEGAAQAPEILRTLPREAIEYVGPGARKSPRAR